MPHWKKGLKNIESHAIPTDFPQFSHDGGPSFLLFT